MFFKRILEEAFETLFTIIGEEKMPTELEVIIAELEADLAQKFDARITRSYKNNSGAPAVTLLLDADDVLYSGEKPICTIFYAKEGETPRGQAYIADVMDRVGLALAEYAKALNTNLYELDATVVYIIDSENAAT